jgi:hypothetical protein
MLEEIRAKIAREISAGLAFEELRALHNIDRWFTFAAFEKSARHLAARWKSFGLSSKVERFPADGASTAGSWVMPYAWDVDDAVLTIEFPAALRGTVIARYRENPTSLAMWSGPTPKAGLVASLVRVDNADDPASYKSLDLDGEILFTSTRPVFAKGLAAEHGAVGILSDFVTQRLDKPDCNFWMNAFSDDPGGWALKLSDSRLFGFNISPRKGAWLRELLAAHGRVTVKAVVSSRIHKGTIPAVTAVIPGAQRGEEVLAIGHAFEQGANDNASGCAVMLEAARALSRLIAAGILPRPRRAIRFLAVSECYTTFAYSERFPKRMASTVAAACFDSVGQRQDICRTALAVHRPPDANASFITAFSERLADVTFAPWRPYYKWTPLPYATTDSIVTDPLIGPPAILLGNYPSDLFWHSNADTPDKVDPAALGKLAEYAAAYLYIIASAGAVDALYLAAIAGAHARARLDLTAGLCLESCRDGALDADAARARVTYAADLGAREIQSVRSLLTLKDSKSIEAELDALAHAVLDTGTRLVDALTRTLRQCRHERPSPKPDPARVRLLRRASRLVPKRKSIGTMSLDLVPLDERQGFSDPRWDSALTAALFWCNGKRTLAEVLDLASLELSRDLLHLVPLFEFLASKDLIALRHS